MGTCYAFAQDRRRFLELARKLKLNPRGLVEVNRGADLVGLADGDVLLLYGRYWADVKRYYSVFDVIREHHARFTIEYADLLVNKKL